MLSFSRNDPNQSYHLHGMWTCEPPVTILNFLSSNEKVRLHFTQDCQLSRNQILIVTGSNCTNVQLFIAISMAIFKTRIRRMRTRIQRIRRTA